MSTLKQVAELIKKDDDIIISNQEKQTDQLSTLNKNFNKFLLDYERKRGDRLEDERERNRRRPGVAGRTVAAGAAAAGSGDGFGIGLGTVLKGLALGGAVAAAKKLANVISERVKTHRGLQLLEQKELKQKTAEAEKEAKRLQKQQEAERKQREIKARQQYAEYRAEAKRLADLEKRRLIVDMFNRRGAQNRMSLADAQRSRVAQAYSAYGESRRSADEMAKAQLKLEESLRNIQNIKSEIKSTPANVSTSNIAALNLQRSEQLAANQRTVSALNIDLNAPTAAPAELPTEPLKKISPNTNTSTLLAPDADANISKSIAKLDTVNTTGSVSRPTVLSVQDVIPSLQSVTSRVPLVEVVDTPEVKQQITDIESKHGVKINVTENGAIDIRNSGANGKKPGTFVAADIRDKVIVDLTTPEPSPKAKGNVKAKVKASLGGFAVLAEAGFVASAALEDVGGVVPNSVVFPEQTATVDTNDYIKALIGNVAAIPADMIDLGAQASNIIAGTNLPTDLGKTTKTKVSELLPNQFVGEGSTFTVGPTGQKVARALSATERVAGESIITGLQIIGNTVQQGSISAGVNKTLKDLQAQDLLNQIEQGRAMADLLPSSNNLYYRPTYSAEQIDAMIKELGKEKTEAFLRSQGVGGLNLLQMPQVTNVNNSSTVVMGESDNAADPSPFAKMVGN